MASPTARSLARLRRLGFIAGVVERRLPIGKFVTQDLWGCIDILAAHKDGRTIGVQATSLTNMAARVTKARLKPELRTWLSVPHRTWECWGWAKRGSRWEVKIVELKGSDLDEACVQALPRRARKSKQAELFA